MLVAAGGDEAGVVGRYGKGEDGVTVGGIGLDEAGFGNGGVGFLGVVEMDGAVRGAGQELMGERGLAWMGIGVREGLKGFGGDTYWPVPEDHCTQCTGPPWPVSTAF